MISKFGKIKCQDYYYISFVIKFYLLKKEGFKMFEASINILSPDGNELSYNLICNQDELNELLRKYDATELSYKRIMQAKLSASKETAFCPYCMKLEFINKKMMFIFARIVIKNILLEYTSESFDSLFLFEKNEKI